MNTQAKTFDNHDKLNRKFFAENLTKAIEADYELYKESYVLSLNSPFGTGKSDFITMWMNSLNLQGYSTAFVNAWETDYIDEPLIPIMHALIDRAKQSSENNEIVSSFAKVIGILANQFTKQYTGFDALGVVKQLFDRDFERSGKKVFENFSKLKSSLSSTKKALKQLVEKCEKKPFFVFVDELDRAKPDYSVKFLERMKHFFGVQGMVFVIAVHKEQLASSMKTIYGEGLDFDGYYRRFINLERNMPSLDQIGFQNYIDLKFKIILDKNLSLSTEEAKKLIGWINILSDFFQPTLRDLNYIFHVFSKSLDQDYMKFHLSTNFGHTYSISKNNVETTERLDLLCTVFFVTFFSIFHSHTYHSLRKEGVHSQNQQKLENLFCDFIDVTKTPSYDAFSTYLILRFAASLKTTKAFKNQHHADNLASRIHSRYKDSKLDEKMTRALSEHLNIMLNYESIYGYIENWVREIGK